MSAIPSDIPAFSGEPTGAAAIFANNDQAVEGADPSIVITRLNSLLRGEISAAETFRNVLSKAAEGSQADIGTLRELQEDHGRACQLIRQRILDLGGEAADSSGVWGIWAQAVQGTLTLFGGDRGGLRALREGEEHGLKDYNAALNDVDPTSAQLIQNQLIPGQERHLSVLDQMLA